MKKILLLLLVFALSGCQLLTPKPEPMLEQSIECYNRQQCFYMWTTGQIEFEVMAGKVREVNTENFIKSIKKATGTSLAWEMERKSNPDGSTTIYARLQCLNKNFCGNYANYLNYVYRRMKSDQIRYKKDNPYFVDPSKMQDNLAPPSPPHVVQ